MTWVFGAGSLVNGNKWEGEREEWDSDDLLRFSQ